METNIVSFCYEWHWDWGRSLCTSLIAKLPYSASKKGKSWKQIEKGWSKEIKYRVCKKIGWNTSSQLPLLLFSWRVSVLHTFFSKSSCPSRRHYISQLPQCLWSSHSHVKIDCPEMLLRDMDPSHGFCNGMCLILLELRLHVLCTGWKTCWQCHFHPQNYLGALWRNIAHPLSNHQFPVQTAFSMTDTIQTTNFFFCSIPLKIESHLPL